MASYPYHGKMLGLVKDAVARLNFEYIFGKLLHRSDDDPADIAAAADSGSGTEASREDHTHQGVASLAKSGDSALSGPVTLSGGANVTLTQAGQDIEVAAAAGVSSNAPQDVGSSASAGSASDASRDDHVHRGVASVAKSGEAAICGAATLSEGDNISLTQDGSDIAIAASGGGTTYKARWTKENDTNLLDASGDYDGPELEHGLTIASFLLEAVYDSGMTFKVQEHVSGTETIRPGSFDDTGITFADDANSYDGDVGTFARAQAGSDTMSFAQWPETGETQWEGPDHQASWASALAVVKLGTAAFAADKEQWRLRFCEDGSTYGDIEAWNSVNAVDEYDAALTDPTGQDWDDLNIRVAVQVIGGPPNTVTLDGYDVRVVGTFDYWSDVVTLTPGTPATGYSVTNNIRLVVDGDNGSKCQCVSLAFTS